jgi:hypothetical protein
MGLANDSDDDRTLLHGFLCIFDLKDSTLRRTDRASEPMMLNVNRKINSQGDGIVVVIVTKHGGGCADVILSRHRLRSSIACKGARNIEPESLEKSCVDGVSDVADASVELRCSHTVSGKLIAR